MQARHSLDVVVEDVRPGVEDGLDAVPPGVEIGHEHLDGGVGQAAADRRDTAGEMTGALVRKIVAGDGGDHDVPQAELRGGLDEALGLGGVGRIGAGRGYGAEAAAAGS